MSEEEREIESYSLSASKAGLGELAPVLKDKFGNIIDGFHRVGENADWHCITVETVDTPAKLALARLAVNYCRRKVSPEELTERITFLIKEGLKPEEIATQTGISLRTVQRYTPQELKDPVKVAARAQISDDTCHQTVKTSDVKLDNVVTCPSCLKVLDSDLEYKLHWSHNHHGPVPKTSYVAPTQTPTLSEPIEDVEGNLAGFSRAAEIEDEEEELQACPCCGSLLTPKDYELTKTEVAIKYGETVQQKLFPEPEVEAPA